MKFGSFVVLISLLLLPTTPAHAVGWSINAEGGAAGPLTNPQRRLFIAGGDTQLKLSLEAASFFDLYANGGFLGLVPSSKNTDKDLGIAWNLGGGIRFKRPYSHGIVSPWIDADIGWYHTGSDINRFGYSVGAGIMFAVGDSRLFRLGPYLRYVQIVNPDHAPAACLTCTTFDSSDAKILVGGLAIEFGNAARHVAKIPPDRDGDGIPDAEDKCPDQPEDRDGFQDQDGCPDLDNDGDGIPDLNDKCPNEPEDKDGYQDEDGCPDPDNDGDGIPDVHDKCPNQAEDKDGFQDDDGCPDPDNDADGILDKDDKCPNEAGPAATGGCPDRDNDGVDDQHDQCPDVPGTPENKGCPVYKNVKVTDNKLEIDQKIFFAFNKSTILPKSFALLSQVAQVLKDHSSIKVRVEGHTDSKGKADHNKTLSLQRAQAVRDYLVKEGIDAGRLEAQGYGSEQPLDTNATAAGREKNRRVEFVIPPTLPTAPTEGGK